MQKLKEGHEDLDEIEASLLALESNVELIEKVMSELEAAPK